MYKIISAADGSTIGTTEKPLYIKKKIESGCYVNTRENQAQGIAYRGTPYNLQGKEGVGAEETVLMIEFDAGTNVDETAETLGEHSAAIDEIIISMLEG